MDKLRTSFIILFVLAFIWGSSFILMKRGLEVFDFMQVASLRISLTFLVFSPIIIKALKSLKKKHVIPLILTSFLGNGIPAFLFTKGQTQLDSSFVGILNATVPLFTIILSHYFFKINLNKANFFGVIIGFFGVLILFIGGISAENYFNPFVFYILLATFCYAISINIINKYFHEFNPLYLASLAFFLIGPPSIIYLLSTDFLQIFSTNQNSFESFTYIAILAIFGTALASVLFYKLVIISSTIFASYITYLIPIVALFWGLIDSENIDNHEILGCVVILSGIYLANFKSKKIIQK